MSVKIIVFSCRLRRIDLAQMERLTVQLDYSGTEMAEMDADRELVASETAGRGFWR